MKLNISKIVIFFLFTATIFSCSNTDEDLFDEPASTRLEKSRQHYQEVLENSEQDWLLQYFPSPDQEYGGVNYYLRFEDGSVTAKLEGEAERVTSSYAVKSRGGTIISFDGYNKLLHRYANPSASSPKGMEGDFEFLVLNQKGDTINLKGLRTGNYMRLIKMKETAEEYNEKANQIEDKFSEISLYDLSNKVKVDIDNARRQITFTEDGMKKSIAFVYTDKGIHLYEAFSYGAGEYQDFVLYGEEDKFSSVRKGMEFKVVFPPFNINKKRWVVSLNPKDNSASAEVFRVFGEAQQANNNKYGMIFYPEIDLGLMPNGTIGFRLFTVDPATFGIYPVMYNLNFRGVLGDKKQLDIRTVSPGVNWDLLPFLQPFLDVLTKNAPYTVEKNNAENPTEIKMISVENPEVWYILKEPAKEGDNS